MALNYETLRRAFRARFAAEPRLFRAPGRVNLIGEHTDYNDGFVLPVAIDREIVVAMAPRPGSLVRAYALDFDEEAHWPVDEEVEEPGGHWSNYLRGVLTVLRRRGLSPQGFDLLLAGDVPIGGGLSSSAALEVAVTVAVATTFEFDLPPTELAQACREAEHLATGVLCGIMDQFVATLGRAGQALFLDCRDLSYDFVPLPLEEARLVIANTNKPRALVDSEYNARRLTCEAGVAFFQKQRPEVRALRDVTAEEVESLRRELPEVVYRRCAHVVHENQRVLDSVAALRAGDLARFGELMNASHESLRDWYEVSCAELDALVEIAWGMEGVYGSRMTGAGFGGCTVTLAQAEAVPELERRIRAEYPARTGLQADVYVCTAADGVTGLDAGGRR